MAFLVLLDHLPVGEGVDHEGRLLRVTPDADVHGACALGDDAHEVEEGDHDALPASRGTRGRDIDLGRAARGGWGRNEYSRACTD